MARRAVHGLLLTLSITALPGFLGAREIPLRFDHEGRLLTAIPAISAGDTVRISVADASPASPDTAPSVQSSPGAGASAGTAITSPYRIECRIFPDLLAAQSPSANSGATRVSGTGELVVKGPWKRGGVLTFDIFRRVSHSDRTDLEREAEQLSARLNEADRTEAATAERRPIKIDILEREVRRLEAEAGIRRESLRSAAEAYRDAELRIDAMRRTMEAIVERKPMEEAEKELAGLEERRDALKASMVSAEIALDEMRDALDALAREIGSSGRPSSPQSLAAAPPAAADVKRAADLMRRRLDMVAGLLSRLEAEQEVEEHLHHGHLLVGRDVAAMQYAAPGMVLVSRSEVTPDDRVVVHLLNVPAWDGSDYMLTVNSREEVGPDEIVYWPGGYGAAAPAARSPGAPPPAEGWPRFRDVMLQVQHPCRGGERVEFSVRDRMRPEGNARGEVVYHSVVTSSYMVFREYRLGLSFGMAVGSLKNREFNDIDGQVVESSRAMLTPVVSVAAYPWGKRFRGTMTMRERLTPAPMVGFAPLHLEKELFFGAQWQPIVGLGVTAGGHLFRDEKPPADGQAAFAAVAPKPVLDEELRLGVFVAITFHAAIFGTRFLSVL